MEQKRTSHRVHRRIRKRRGRPKSLGVFALLLITTIICLDIPKAGVYAQSMGAKTESLRVTISEFISDLKQSGVSTNDIDTPTAEERKLMLVNPWTSIPENYEVNLAEISNGHYVDEMCYEDLQAMLDDCREAGLSPVICSSYRTMEKQTTLFQNQVNRMKAKGYSEESARVEAGKSVAAPGTSEHQLGLAVDIVDINNQNLNKSQEQTAVQKWLIENSWKYGFILRYPNGKSDITGIIYEPWHYRYVGKEAAKEIYEQEVCLEEYIDQIK